MIRPDELRAIKAGEVDLAFRRWDRPRVRVGTRMKTPVGLVEVSSVDRVALGSITAADAHRAGAPTLKALKAALSHRPDQPVFRVGLRFAGADPRVALRDDVPDDAQVEALVAWLDRLDAASTYGPWTRPTLRIIDRWPAVRAPELAAELGRPTGDFKRDVRKLKERGLTESLSIGYRLSPRGEAVLDHGGPRRERTRPEGTVLPRIGAPATRALAAAGVTTLEQVRTWSVPDLLALHGVGPMAVSVLQEVLADRGETLAGG
jgi:hypothetical protein